MWRINILFIKKRYKEHQNTEQLKESRQLFHDTGSSCWNKGQIRHNGRLQLTGICLFWTLTRKSKTACEVSVRNAQLVPKLNYPVNFFKIISCQN